MKEILTVTNSDSVNLYGYAFAFEALEDITYRKALLGVPSCIGHDMLRPVGWNFPLGLYIEPKLTRTISTLIIPDKKEEEEEIRQLHTSALIRQYSEMCKPHIDILRNITKPYLSGEEKHIHCGCTCIIDEGILEKLFPNLIEKKDKDGLIFFKDLQEDFKYIEHGVFKHLQTGLAVLVHPFFRRSLSRHNNFHYIFLDELIAQSSNENVNIRIALDWNIIGYAADFSPSFELEYWFGPKYNDNITKIKLGLTRHECSEFQRSYYGISSTEFLWKKDEGEHVFECEELKDNPVPELKDKYGCRYVHSIYNPELGKFRHFDGAIRMYSEDMMIERLDKNFNKS